MWTSRHINLWAFHFSFARTVMICLPFLCCPKGKATSLWWKVHNCKRKWNPISKTGPHLPINNIISANTRGPCCHIHISGKIVLDASSYVQWVSFQKKWKCESETSSETWKSQLGAGSGSVRALADGQHPQQKGEWDGAWLQTLTFRSLFISSTPRAMHKEMSPTYPHN